MFKFDSITLQSMPTVFNIKISKEFDNELKKQSPQYQAKVWDSNFTLLNRIKNGDKRNLCKVYPEYPNRHVYRIRIGSYDEHSFLITTENSDKVAFIGIDVFEVIDNGDLSTKLQESIDAGKNPMK